MIELGGTVDYHCLFLNYRCCRPFLHRYPIFRPSLPPLPHQSQEIDERKWDRDF